MTAPTLSGSRLRLRPIEPDDVDARQQLGWHATIERGYGRSVDSREATAAEAQGWYDAVVAQDSDTFWVVEVDGSLAGTAFLFLVDEHDRRARYAIGMLAPRYVGRGLGTEATRLVLAHAFDTLGLHRVDLRVLAFNIAARACYRRCGFVEEGVERESCWLDDAWRDDIMMAVLDREFAASR